MSSDLANARGFSFVRRKASSSLEPLRPVELGLAALVDAVVEGIEEDGMPAQPARIQGLRDTLADAALRIAPAALGHLVVPDRRAQEVPPAAEVPLVGDDLPTAPLVDLAAVDRRCEVWELWHAEPRGGVGLLQPAVIVDPEAGERFGVPRIQRVTHADPRGADRVPVGQQVASDPQEAAVVLDAPLHVHVGGVGQMGNDSVAIEAVVRQQRPEDRVVGVESARLAGVGHAGLVDAHHGQAVVERDSRCVQVGTRVQLDARAEAHDRPVILDDREVAVECLAARAPAC